VRIQTKRKLSDLLNLAGEMAVVTGAGMGIGQAIAVRLAEAGANVAVTDYDERAARETAAAITADGGSATAFHMDVADAGAVRSVISQIAQERGRIDVLVNNAGIFPMRPFLDSDDALWSKTLEVNVMGAARCTRAVLPHMIKAGAGAVVNIASIDAFHPTGNLVHYDTSKGGLVMMTKSLAWEVRGTGVRVNAVAPGGIQTPGVAALQAASPRPEDAAALEAAQRAFLARIPLGRMGQPDDIATVVLFLASPMAGYVTGETIVVDGGFLLS